MLVLYIPRTWYLCYRNIITNVNFFAICCLQVTFEAVRVFQSDSRLLHLPSAAPAVCCTCRLLHLPSAAPAVCCTCRRCPWRLLPLASAAPAVCCTCRLLHLPSAAPAVCCTSRLLHQPSAAPASDRASGCGSRFKWPNRPAMYAQGRGTWVEGWYIVIGEVLGRRVCKRQRDMGDVRRWRKGCAKGEKSWEVTLCICTHGVSSTNEMYTFILDMEVQTLLRYTSMLHEHND